MRTRRAPRMSFLRIAAVLPLLMAAALDAAPARADGLLPLPLPHGTAGMIGGNVGGVSHHGGGPAGIVAGVEASLVHLWRGGVWAGGYGDVLWDSGLRGVTTSVGPEIGWLLLGVDGGLVFQADLGGHTAVGYAIRPMLSLGFVDLYYRFSETRGALHEIGVLVKVPVLGDI